MADQQYTVEVQHDFLKKITAAKPIQALSELIWNALDADSTLVDVDLIFDELDSLSEIVIRDNGNGIAHNDAPEYFQRLGGSWKRPGAATAGGRFLHGQEGRGRFKAFSLGNHAEWDVVYKKDKKSFSYKISMSASNIRRVVISDEFEVPTTDTGVTLTIRQPPKNFNSFDGESGLQSLAEIFALYLTDYPAVVIRVSGRRVDPESVIASRKRLELSEIAVEDKKYSARLEIVEWKSISNRSLFLCNEGRFPLVQTDRRFHVGKFQFSAYLQSSYLNKAQQEGTVELVEMQPGVTSVIEEAVRLIKNYFRERAAVEAQEYVQEWKTENIYPYDKDPQNSVEEVERQVFDIVAVSVAKNLPDFDDFQAKNKAFQLRMLRQAIESSPDDLQIILTEVLNLPKRKQEELAELLKEVSLTAIISSAKVVADRLRFLVGLETIVFEKDFKKVLKERSQLHRIISQNTWLFGEEFGLSVDDQSLTEVLRQHKKILGEDIVIDVPVKHVSQDRGIVDLMLSKSSRRHKVNSLSHLVVELKAPKVKLDRDEVSQIEGYAASVVADERFSNVDVNWQFWAISDELGQFGKFKVGSGNGQIFSQGNVQVFLKTWAQIIDENRSRLQFFQEKLEYQADRGSSLEFLKNHYAKYLKGVLEESNPISNKPPQEDE